MTTTRDVWAGKLNDYLADARECKTWLEIIEKIDGQMEPKTKETMYREQVSKMLAISKKYDALAHEIKYTMKV